LGLSPLFFLEFALFCLSRLLNRRDGSPFLSFLVKFPAHVFIPRFFSPFKYFRETSLGEFFLVVIIFFANRLPFFLVLYLIRFFGPALPGYESVPLGRNNFPVSPPLFFFLGFSARGLFLEGPPFFFLRPFLSRPPRKLPLTGEVCSLHPFSCFLPVFSKVPPVSPFSKELPWDRLFAFSRGTLTARFGGIPRFSFLEKEPPCNACGSFLFLPNFFPLTRVWSTPKGSSFFEGIPFQNGADQQGILLTSVFKPPVDTCF